MIGIAIQSQASLSQCLATVRSRSLLRGEYFECLLKSQKSNGATTAVQRTQNQAMQRTRDEVGRHECSLVREPLIAVVLDTGLPLARCLFSRTLGYALRETPFVRRPS
jgi:hypothetical protein